MSVNDGKPDWRTQETFDEYIKERGGRTPSVCVLCDAPVLQDFNHWKIIPNKFPYDRVADKHELLLLKRHSNGEDLTVDERGELDELKKSVLGNEYGFIMQTLGKTTSIPSHLHYHLIQPKSFE